ncbi:probable serine/threonine-protein kinase yakA [Anopheles funestus]|uniref:probable serine/threonine-protein kinase yakA n=1 Tax=Anopheles funestus TaxID=62324 RepID=UPI0020C5C1E3|nr:probable serine/threonine-protein kinase yakA [Anopheles funestus]
MLKMEKSHHFTRIWFGLVLMAVISVPPRVISMPCTSGANGQTVNAIRSDRASATGSKSAGAPNAVPTIASSTPSAIKKDLFMSRGWGAGGMPFSMFYLNHYTKAHKAYAQNQQQQQQQQLQQQQLQQQQQQQQQQQGQQQLQKQAQEQSIKEQQLLRIQEDRSSGRSQEDTADKDTGYPLPPKTLPFGTGYAPEPNAVHAQQLRTDTDYVDGASSVRTSKVNTPRRQYTVPQLFVSYGWGPLG